MDEKLKVIITATIDDFKNKTNEAKKQLQSLSSEGEKSSSKLKNAMSKIGSATKTALAASAKAVAAGVGVAAAGIGAIVKSAVQSYAEYEQLVGGVETMFKQNASTVQKYAAEAYKTAGISANTYMEQVTSFSASLLQSLGGDTKKAAEYANTAVLDMSDNANKFGTDIQSIQDAYQGFAKQNYTMLDNLKLGYGGTKTEMERLISDANKVKEANGEMADLSIDSFADVVEAIHIMQNEMGITGTTAKEATETISGSLLMAKAAWSNLLTGIADDNANFQQLIDNFVESASIAFENILPRVVTALNGVAQLIDSVFPLIMQKIPEIINSVLPNLVSAAVNIVTSFAQGLTTGMPQITSALVSIVSIILGALPQLIEAGVQMIAALITGIAQSIPQIVATIVTIIPQIVNSLVSNIGLILQAGITLLLALVDAIPVVITALVPQIPTIVQTIVSTLIANLPVLIVGAVQLFMGIVKAIPQIIVALATAVPQIVVAIVKGLISGAGQVLSGAAKMFEGVITKAGEAKDKAAEKLEELKAKASEKFESIKSTANEKWESIKSTISDKASSAKDKASTAFSSMKDSISQKTESAKSAVRDKFTSIASTIGSKMSDSKSKVDSKLSEIKSAFSTKLSSGLSTVKSTMGSIASAFGDKMSTAHSKVKSAIDKIKGCFKFSWSLPKLKLPHISISGSFSINPPSVPHFGISWYAKGGVFDKRTLFPWAGGIGGLGENGAEAIVPLEKNTGWLDRLATMLNEKQGGGVPIILQVDGKTFAEIAVESINDLTAQRGSIPLRLI